jgi:hypothetical protein
MSNEHRKLNQIEKKALLGLKVGIPQIIWYQMKKVSSKHLVNCFRY